MGGVIRSEGLALSPFFSVIGCQSYCGVHKPDAANDADTADTANDDEVEQDGDEGDADGCG
jgi:hypothetical protein